LANLTILISVFRRIGGGI